MPSVIFLTMLFFFLQASTMLLQQVKGQECNHAKNYIFGTGGHVVNKTSSYADCCHLCANGDVPGTAESCKSWVWHTDTGLCWLHSDYETVSTRDDVISGVVNGPLPPLPRPSPPIGPMGGWSGPEACTEGTNGTKYKFCDPSLSLEERLDDLVARVDIHDIAYQLTARQSSTIPELGLPSYYWGTNAIHGVQNVQCLPNGKCPTSFPAPCALSAAFNTSLVYDMGNVIGQELRGYYNGKIHNSLDTWSPTININRDPRWGRNVESPGEDPFVAASYGIAYTQGLQQYSGDEDVVQAIVTLKHFFAYSIEDWKNVKRTTVDVKVSAYDMSHTYLYAWEQLVKVGKALGIMCSYNAVNGVATCGNPALNKTLREDWGFEGYITSDSDSCACITGGHPQGTNIDPNLGPPIEGVNGSTAAARCLKGGTDIDSGHTYVSHLFEAINATKELDVATARLGLRNSYKMRMMLGLFDPEKDNKYKHIGMDVVGSERHQEMSLLAAKKGMVLLKKGPLPFPKGINVAVIGQSVSNTNAYTGNYDGPLCPKGGADCFPNLGEAIQKLNEGGTTNIVAGTDVSKAVEAAKSADYVVLAVDNAKDGGGEGHDRETIGLSSSQIELAKSVIEANKNVALLLINGGIIAIDDLKDTAPAILECFMPGVHGGTAMAHTIFGDNNPGGKLPVTMYHSSYVNETDFLSMDMNNGKGRSYKYYTGNPLYEFGYGLSYTNFTLQWDDVEPETLFIRNYDVSYVKQISVKVKNTGNVAGDEVIMAFTRPNATSFSTTGSLGNSPIEKKKLFAFKRISLSPGESETVTFELKSEHLTMTDEFGNVGLHSGKFEIAFSKGHGKDLVSNVIVDVSESTQGFVMVKKFRKWW